MDWKDDIGSYFQENSIYRLDFLNKRLAEYCKEWKEYLGEFSKVDTNIDGYIPEIKISVKNINKNFYPFKVYIYFQPSQSGNQCCLHIKYTKSITRSMKKIIAFDQKDDEFYNWGEEEITDSEAVEKGFILQILNNRFKAYDSPKLRGS